MSAKPLNPVFDLLTPESRLDPNDNQDRQLEYPNAHDHASSGQGLS